MNVNNNARMQTVNQASHKGNDTTESYAQNGVRQITGMLPLIKPLNDALFARN